MPGLPSGFLAFRFQDMNVFLGLVDAGSLADLSAVRETYQSPEVKDFLDQHQEAIDGATFDGKLLRELSLYVMLIPAFIGGKPGTSPCRGWSASLS